ncbi:MAG: DNA-processing protein DprA, partial [Verrucomicrobiae bacterium]|nr:DNA-processing protein DprA [Verrucomicrobiae bacterium]
MTNTEAFIALNMIDGVGPVRLRKLLEYFGEASAILRARKESLVAVPGIGEEIACAISDWENRIDLSGEIKRIEEYGCKVFCLEDEEYPALLKQIYDPPVVLYVMGNILPKDKNAIAVVGSRLTTHYGIESARRLAYQLAFAGVTV